MFYKVLENNTILKSDNKESLTKLYSNVLELTNVNLSEFLKNQDKYELQNGVFINIANTAKYQALHAEKSIQQQILSIKSQIEELDKKRIRAICEPEIKDIESGQTWLEYYNSKISALREELIKLSS